MQDRVDEILRKLAVLRERGVPVFGSDIHHFELNPCLSEAEIVGFETERRARLPEEYRAFLAHAGDGGAGPDYGLWGLESWNHITEERFDADDLDEPCPLDPDAPPKAIDWAADRDSLKKALRGTLTLNSKGCTYYTALIVTGRARGRVIHLDVGGQPAVFSSHGGFFDWYEAWLDEALQETALGVVELDLPSDEPALLDLLRRGERLGGVLRALARLERLGAETLEGVAALRGHEDPMVRLAVLEVVARHGHERHLLAVPLLRDPDASVRSKALEIARYGPVEPIEDELRRLVNDPEPEIVSRALQAMPWQSIDLPMLRPLLRHPNEQIRIVATEWVGLCTLDAEEQDLPELLDYIGQMLDGPRLYTAHRALGLLQGLEAPHLVERVRVAAMGDHSDLTDEALKALHFQDPEAARPALQKHLSSFPYRTRALAAELLGVELKDPPPPRSDDPSGEQRQAWEMYHLGRGDHLDRTLKGLLSLPELWPAAVERVVELLEHEDRKVCAHALEVLAQHARDRYALGFPFLDSPHAVVRSSAVKLVSVGPRELWEAKIVLMLNDAVDLVVCAAVEALRASEHADVRALVDEHLERLGGVGGPRTR